MKNNCNYTINIILIPLESDKINNIYLSGTANSYKNKNNATLPNIKLYVNMYDFDWISQFLYILILIFLKNNIYILLNKK